MYTKTVTFTQNDFGYIIDTSKLEKIDAFTPKPSGYTYAKSIWFGYENSSWKNRPLNIAEIEVYSGGVNVAKNATKTESSSQYTTNYFKPKNLIDGNMSNFAHTNNSGTNWFKITLDKRYPIEKVILKVPIRWSTRCLFPPFNFITRPFPFFLRVCRGSHWAQRRGPPGPGAPPGPKGGAH